MLQNQRQQTSETFGENAFSMLNREDTKTRRHEEDIYHGDTEPQRRALDAAPRSGDPACRTDERTTTDRCRVARSSVLHVDTRPASQAARVERIVPRMSV